MSKTNLRLLLRFDCSMASIQQGTNLRGKMILTKKKKKGNEVREFDNEIYKMISHTVHPCVTPSLECQAML